MKKLVGIDGNSIMNRAFYGIMNSKLLMTSDGVYTNAIFGFLSILNKLIADESPDYICVAFDLKAPTFRHEKYEGYKATRKGMPDELRVQMPIIKDILRAMNIKILEMEGYEADDILGTLASYGENNDMDVLSLIIFINCFTCSFEPVKKAGILACFIFLANVVSTRLIFDIYSLIVINGTISIELSNNLTISL